MVKNLPANAEDVALIPGSGRSLGGGNSNPLQYSYLENPMARGAWRAPQSMGLQNETLVSAYAHTDGLVCHHTDCSRTDFRISLTTAQEPVRN